MRSKSECAKVAQGIWDRKVKDAAAAFAQLKAVYPSDEQFKDRLRDFRKATSTKTVYIFHALEREAERQATDKPVAGSKLDTDVTVEHILPQRPGEEWPPELADDEDDLTSWIGNLCLLRKGANRKLGRAAFAEKRALYAESGLRLTREIASEYQVWDKDAIIRRQNYLAELGVLAWRFQ